MAEASIIIDGQEFTSNQLLEAQYVTNHMGLLMEILKYIVRL